MARIGDDSLIVRGEQRADGTWLFTIRYTVHFEPGELGTRFADSVQVSADSRATSVPFLACGRSVLRKKRVVVDDRTLTDEAYATVCVRRRGGADALTQSARLRRISTQSPGTRPRGPGVVSSDGRLSGGARSGPS
ncbi:hypothetical protein H7J51_11400 [Mycobacterium crocinum]|uniref:Uncharacterized protein n=2 Tax=Mycolicibacterium TaxID=1866885 RepID=A0ABX8VEF0_9MYCO|nr:MULTISPECIES: hypothetical protein [Mycolicibacterium]APE18351.1 hypothetical protein BOH72_26820 [Mycobacterium sp. WY10]MCV7215889.1 hypothetical protein [Mycolicibacterium crocinum]QYL16166.1 hypothetical protein K0O64_24535 [Mycolicibacterium pallens]ULN40843.1 hypothetical protein MI149_24945 [Mycolicibacterium crocinum]